MPLIPKHQERFRELRKGCLIQSILFPADRWNEVTSREWLRKHDFLYTQHMDHRAAYLRFRQYNPIPNEKYRTKNIDHGIKFIVSFTPHDIDIMRRQQQDGERFIKKRYMDEREMLRQESQGIKIKPRGVEQVTSKIAQIPLYNFIIGESKESRKGGFLPILLPILGSVLAGIAGPLVKKGMDKLLGNGLMMTHKDGKELSENEMREVLAYAIIHNPRLLHSYFS